MRSFKVRARALAVHLLISSAFVALSASLVYLVWYPEPLAKASNVTDVFVLIMLVDVVIGPVITFLVFDKQKKALKRDLITIGVLQLFALGYGLHAVFVARPVYVVFNAGQFDLVFANDLSDVKVKDAALPAFQALPVLGVRIIAAKLPDDQEAALGIVSNAIFSGEDVQHMPKYYIEYGDAVDAVKKSIQPMSNLSRYNPARKDYISLLNNKYESLGVRVGYIAFLANHMEYSALMDADSGEVLELVELKPF